MKKLDLIGERFGRLLVVDRAQPHKHPTRWICVCDCGNTTVTQTSNLRSGNTKSCGCKKSEPRKRIDLTGIRFGRLVVIRYIDTTKGQVSWLCQCDCGNVVVAKTMKLRRGHTSSCGCLRDYLLRTRRPLGGQKWARMMKQIFQSCVACGDATNLHSHHIYPVSTHKKMKTDTSNGVVFCKTCHEEFHRRYGKHSHGPNELAEFLNMPPSTKLVLSHICGWKAKNGVEDLKKARHFLDMLIEFEEQP